MGVLDTFYVLLWACLPPLGVDGWYQLIGLKVSDYLDSKHPNPSILDIYRLIIVMIMMRIDGCCDDNVIVLMMGNGGRNSIFGQVGRRRGVRRPMRPTHGRHGRHGRGSPGRMGHLSRLNVVR